MVVRSIEFRMHPGSTEVGKLIVQAAGKTNLKKVALELGGKSPNVVFKDAEKLPGGIQGAIDGAAAAIFFNQGQVCSAGSKLLVEKSVFDQVVEGVSKRAKSIRLGSGMDPNTEMGPLINQEQFDKVRGLIGAGQKDGASIMAGGADRPSGVDAKGYFVKPTVITKTNPKMSVVREEIFGPVVVAEAFDDYDALVRAANNTEYGLASGIFTSDIKKAHRLAADIRAGTVWINCYNVFDASLPFGGYKQSVRTRIHPTRAHGA
jgi:phenylacetaldehyde dehydrogenase